MRAILILAVGVVGCSDSKSFIPVGKGYAVAPEKVERVMKERGVSRAEANRLIVARVEEGKRLDEDLARYMRDRGLDRVNDEITKIMSEQSVSREEAVWLICKEAQAIKHAEADARLQEIEDALSRLKAEQN